MRFSVLTLGCKVNQYETRAVESLLTGRGHSHCGAEEADVIIVNTCAVTAESEKKSLRSVRRMKALNPSAAVAVCGCCSQIGPDSFSAAGADVVFGTADKDLFVSEVERISADPIRKGLRRTGDPRSREEFECLPAGAFAGRTRAVLKIQDGCDNFCSFCVVPYARGKSRSLPLARAESEARELAGSGYREIVLTGIEIASYGADLENRPSLIDLSRAVSGAAPEARIRLGSLDPVIITEDFCRKLAGIGAVCRHFHLSLQSGCDATLKRMGRKYDTGSFYASLLLLRKYFPGCAAACDLIVGFPGETRADHSETMAFIRKCSFAFMHVFPFSARPGTEAAEAGGFLPNEIKARRAEEAGKAAAEMRDSYLRSRVGSTESVLFEKCADGGSSGRGDNFCPVTVPGAFNRGTVENVLISAVSRGALAGTVV